jgi:hypothetical protein
MMNPMPPQDCPTGAVLVSAVNNGSTEETVANVAWGIGAGVGALGVGLLVAGVVQGGSETNAAGPRVTLIVDPSHGFAGIRGTF